MYPQKNVVDAQCNPLTILQDDVASEFVDVLARTLAIHLSCAMLPIVRDEDREERARQQGHSHLGILPGPPLPCAWLERGISLSSGWSP